MSFTKYLLLAASGLTLTHSSLSAAVGEGQYGLQETFQLPVKIQECSGAWALGLSIAEPKVTLPARQFAKQGLLNNHWGAEKYSGEGLAALREGNLTVHAKPGQGFFNAFMNIIDASIAAKRERSPSPVVDWRGWIYNRPDPEEMRDQYLRFVPVKYGHPEAGWEPRLSPNSFTEYFKEGKRRLEHVDPDKKHEYEGYTLPRSLHDRFDELHLVMPDLAERETYRRVVGAYMAYYAQPGNGMVQRVDDFWSQHIGSRPAIGVHIRTTDKGSETQSGRTLPIKQYQPMVEKALAMLAESHPGQPPVIIVESDSAQAISLFRDYFPHVEVVAQKAVRASGMTGTAPHLAGNPRYEDRVHMGVEVMSAAMILGRADHLIHSESNVALAAYYGGKGISHFVENK